MAELNLDFHPASARLEFGSAQRVPTGTTDYEELQNLPQINGEELIGNKTAEELGLATPEDIPKDNAELENGAGYVTAAEAAAAAPVKSVNGKAGEVELDAEDVGALPADTPIPSKTSDLTNDSGYQTAQQVSAAVAAATEPIRDSVSAIEGKIPAAASTSNKLMDTAAVNAAIAAAVAGIHGISFEVVQTLPASGDTGTIYLVPHSGGETRNVFDEYIWLGSSWELLGTSEIDLTGYATESWVQSQGYLTQHQDISGKLDKTGDAANTTVSFAQAAQRAAITTGEKLSVLLGKIARWLADLGTAAFKNSTSSVTSGSSDLVESGAVYTAVSGKYTKPAGGIPKTDLAQAVQTSLGKADTALQSVPDTYRTAVAQDVIDAAKLPTSTKYAGSQSVGGAADKAVSIPMGSVDDTSTATAFTATIDGITELRAGVCVWLTNGVVTSAAGCTLNINSLGAKPIYNSIAAQTATTTTFNINYTMLFIYNAARVEGGCWDMVYGYDANTTYTPVKLGFGYATCTTAAATAAKVATLSSYTLVANSLVSVHFSNDVPAGATLNINSKGAKAIYYKDAAITAGVIKGGDTALFVYSTYYRLLSIDRWGTDIAAALEPHYGLCSTAAATQEKTVTVSGITALYDGLRVTILFANAQTYSGAPTLNVNNLGAAPIRRTLTANAAIYEWQAGQVLTLVYATDSGSGCWVIDNGALSTTTYAGRVKLQTSAASESESMAATPQSINQLAQTMVSGAPIYVNGSFAAGDLCRRGAVIYRRISAGTDAAWTASNWEALPPLLEMLEQGGVQVVTVSGTTPTITTLPGVRYVCGECATLDITPPASGICDVIFTSGSTATVLTVPSSVRWANGFDPTALEADTTYEINILDGLGVAASWT